MKKGLVVIGVISAGLVIGGTIWYFKSKSPKSNEGDSDENKDKSEDIPDTTKQTSVKKETVASNTEPTKNTTSVNVIDEVKSKLGSGARVKNNSVFAPFNSNKNIAVFYSNGRFSIFKIGEEKKGTLLKGTFKDGGLTLIPDKGKQVTSSSTWTNLNNLFKK